MDCIEIESQNILPGMFSCQRMKADTRSAQVMPKNKLIFTGYPQAMSKFLSPKHLVLSKKLAPPKKLILGVSYL